MTMIDEEVLSNALHQTANAFEVSSEATTRILSEATDSAPPTGIIHTPAFIREPGRARSLLAAAVLVLVVGAISVPLLRGEGTPATSRTAIQNNALKSLGTPHGTKLSVRGAPLSGSSFTNASATSGQLTFGVAQPTSLSLSPKVESNGTVDLTVRVGHVESAFASLSAIVIKDGGFVNGNQAHVGTGGAGHFSYGTIVLQVPQRRFALLVSQVQHVGKVTSVNTTSADVTSQYVDLRARISALEVSRAQYLTIMTRAKSIGDILAVQSQLNNLQSQIEQLQGQLNVLNNATTYSTLTVAVTEAGQPTHVTHHRSGLTKAFYDSVHGFVAGFEWLVRLAGPVLFALLMLGALSALGRIAWRAARRRRI